MIILYIKYLKIWNYIDAKNLMMNKTRKKEEYNDAFL